MVNSKYFIIICFASACTLLSGCDAFRNTLGLDHYQPDEFSVDVKPELKMPPDFNLKPPSPGEPDRGYIPQTIQAQRKLYGQEVQLESTHNKSAEQTILTTASQDVSVDPDIRKKVNNEAQSDSSVLERIKNFKDKTIKNLTLAEDADVKTPGPSANSETGVEE